jgi:hypothetical protein
VYVDELPGPVQDYDSKGNPIYSKDSSLRTLAQSFLVNGRGAIALVYEGLFGSLHVLNVFMNMDIGKARHQAKQHSSALKNVKLKRVFLR